MWFLLAAVFIIFSLKERKRESAIWFPKCVSPPASIHYSKQSAAASEGFKQWRYFSVSTTTGRDGKGFPGVQLRHAHGPQMTEDVDTCGWRRQALHSGPWSHMHWEAHLPFLGQRITRNRQANKPWFIEMRVFSALKWLQENDWNEWMVLIIKEKQIELLWIGLLFFCCCFYLDASLLLLVRGPLKSADWTRPVKLAICFSMACILSL